MFTMEDLIENQKMNKIIKQNQIKMRELNIKRTKKQKKENILNNIFMLVCSSVFMLGLMYLINVIENLRF